MIIYNAIAILYLFSGLWCSFQPLKSMGYLGYGEAETFTVAEFVTVYGGLQIGIALAMLSTTFLPQYYGGTLLFATILSISLIVVRIVSMLAYGWFAQGFVMGALELAMAIALLALFYRHHMSSGV